MSGGPPRAVVVLVADARAAEHICAAVAREADRRGAGDIVVRCPADSLRCAGFWQPGAAAQRAVAAWWRGHVGIDRPRADDVVLVVDAEDAEGAGRLDAGVVAIPAASSRAVDTAPTGTTGPGDDEALVAIARAVIALLQAPARAATAASGPAPAAAAVVRDLDRGSADTSPARRPPPAPGRPRLGIARQREPDLGAHVSWLLHPGHPAPVIVVTNPKGGPGKTTTAIGLALSLERVLGEAHVNGRVVLVDGNTRMSDTFRSMPVAEGAATVRSVVARLRTSAAEVPALQHANERAPGLVVLREEEDSGGYLLQEIAELARWLRSRFHAIVVDLVNDVPGTGSPTEQLVQWWLMQADIAVVPVKASINDFEGAERLLRAAPDVPAVVAYLRPPQRRLDRHPTVRHRLGALRACARSICTIPEDYRARTAALDHLNLTDASGALRRGFAELAVEVLAVRLETAARASSVTRGGASPPPRSHVAWDGGEAGPFGPLRGELR